MTLLTPEFLQTQKYSALRDRMVMEHSGSLQPGVFDNTDFRVTQRAAGPNLSVDVALGSAIVDANQPGNQGFYHIQNDSSVNVTTGAVAGHASLPRVDSVIVQIQDSTHGGASSDVPVLKILSGTPTSGATLDNRSGAPLIQPASVVLADILVPTGATTLTTSMIRDRRPWARGAFYGATRTAGDVSAPIASWASIGSEFTARLELSGRPVKIGYNLRAQCGTAAADYVVRVLTNGSPANGSNSHDRYTFVVANRQQECAATWIIPSPTPGSCLFSLQHQSPSAAVSLAANGSMPAEFYVEELARQNFSNGAA